MGNCDTHLFLGSNSTKTVEYFSKALGEKTISRESTSVNKDKDKHKTGYTDSDQIMARALMTPDELRRMSMDYAIIYEKGLKPIKAKKFFYFKSNMIKEFEKFKLDHNQYNGGERGAWRRFNPYNPDQGATEEPQKDLKIDSLDDLFDDGSENEGSTNNNSIEGNNLQENNNAIDLASFDDLLSDESETTNNKKQQNKITDSDLDELFADDYSDTAAPTDSEILDIQKELEAKFDELFGSSSNDN